ncbi:MAG: hypothetical protein E5W82_23010 [Mesorhizobium sp.]|uniref:hypothetical protein n=1 Tax=Mesorhizobium sp. TaxID=1871066 RepID=UPI00121E13D4|nr:hypothetical protein [Mesorhizobium sp.]TIS55813.1 MAG: hypothetical protein E5W91_20720 [Mesorhizobium sp.]TJW07585.1 MAG: hypothetical protein E5W82_23010 [Mesorhizobium sp.]TJW41248.1 MAG: hypothetical protein E5W83_26390 [Mesorhizobium sp.]
MPNRQRDVRGYLVSYGGLLGIRVELFEADGEWFVHVVEDDEERTYSFALKSFALAFAEGQRMRIKPPSIVRLERNPSLLFGHARVTPVNDRF